MVVLAFKLNYQVQQDALKPESTTDDSLLTNLYLLQQKQ